MIDEASRPITSSISSIFDIRLVSSLIKYKYNGIILATTGFISDNDIEEIRLINKVDGDLSPESLFPNNANKLRGFDWRGEERPMTVEDIFKDDPPLILPKIKGLDDYVPSEEFIDDAVTEKIEAAGKATPNKPNKAARNLPSQDSITNKTILQKPVIQKPTIQKPVKEKLKTATIKKKTGQ